MPNCRMIARVFRLRSVRSRPFRLSREQVLARPVEKPRLQEAVYDAEFL